MIQVSANIISSEAVLKSVEVAGHGGECVFFGRVREINHGRKVVSVSYDAFAPLAEETFRLIIEEARVKWGTLQASVVHRTGRLMVGDCSIAIAVSSKHRDEAFQACRYVIEQVKVRAPIWKKEVYEDGETEWLQGHSLCGHTEVKSNHV